MNREELNRELDQWLDRASAEFGRAETRPGFEARVIANVNSRLERNGWRFHRLLPAAALAAALILLILSFWSFRAPVQERRMADIASVRTPEAKIPPAQIPQEDTQPDISSTQTSKISERDRQTRRKAVETQRGRFLSSGLSDQERNLIAFVRAVSKQAAEFESEPLQEPKQIPEFIIPEFKIPPFKIDVLPMQTQNGNEEQL